MASEASPTSLLARLGWVVPAIGLPALVVATVLAPSDAGAAARQDWPPFVLVGGLLLLGLVARADGIFDAAGALVARLARGGFTLLAAATALVAVVTAVLNLDTSVAFLTPVLVAAARRRRTGEELLLYLSVFLANGASLLLPGSNLTNLIVIGDRHLSGGAFAAAMLPAWIAAVITIPAVLAVIFRRDLSPVGVPRPAPAPPARPRVGAGTVGVVVAVVAMLALSGGTVAVVVAATGCAAAGWHLARHRLDRREVAGAVQMPVLAGLFGLAVALGTLGRVWSGPRLAAVPRLVVAGSGVGRGHQRRVQQPAGGLPARRPASSRSSRPTGRVEPRPQPGGDRCPVGRDLAPGGPGVGQPAIAGPVHAVGADRDPPVDGCRVAGARAGPVTPAPGRVRRRVGAGWPRRRRRPVRRRSDTDR